MAHAFEINVDSISLRNNSTTTIGAYKFVRMSATTETDFGLVGITQTQWPIGITQQAISPGMVGPIGISGISRLRVGTTGWTTIWRTTVIGIGPNAAGNGIRMTTSLMKFRAVAFHTATTSDIAVVILKEPSRFGY